MCDCYSGLVLWIHAFWNVMLFEHLLCDFKHGSDSWKRISLSAALMVLHLVQCICLCTWLHSIHTFWLWVFLNKQRLPLCIINVLTRRGGTDQIHRSLAASDSRCLHHFIFIILFLAEEIPQDYTCSWWMTEWKPSWSWSFQLGIFSTSISPFSQCFLVCTINYNSSITIHCHVELFQEYGYFYSGQICIFNAHWWNACN